MYDPVEHVSQTVHPAAASRYVEEQRQSDIFYTL